MAITRFHIPIAAFQLARCWRAESMTLIQVMPIGGTTTKTDCWSMLSVMIPTECVELNGCLTFREALRWYYLLSPWCNFWSNRNALVNLVLIPFLVLGLPKLPLPAVIADGFSPAAFGGSLLIALAFVAFILPYFFAWQRYHDPGLSGETHYTFDAIGYEVAQRGWRYRVDWASVREIRESKSMFFLYLLPTQSTIIPKRIFPDGQTLAAWRSNIATNAPSVSINRNSVVGRFL